MKETAGFLNDSAVRLAAENLHEEAIASLRKGLILEPKNSTLWLNLALSYRALSKLEEARNALFQAAKGNPLDVDILDTLGVVLHEIGEDSASEEIYLNALEISPGNGRVWNNYGVLQFSQSRFTEACQSFEKAIVLIPDFDDALYNLRDTYEELGKTEAMEKCSAMLALRESKHG
jgi:tetratricopeptide (TPR) repeat protein